MSKFIPNSFQLPNAFVDEAMSKMSDPAVKMYLLIVRKTRGWHKEFDSISISQFMKFTGKSRPTVCRSVQELIALKLVVRLESTKHGETYALDDNFYDGVVLKFASKKSLLVKEFYQTSKKSLLVLVKNFNTQKTLSKNTKKDTTHTCVFEEQFKAFWTLYPNHKAGLPKTKDAFKKALKVASFETIMNGLNQWVNSSDWKKENGRYVCFSTKFLNQQLWTAFDGQTNVPTKKQGHGRDVNTAWGNEQNYQAAQDDVETGDLL